MQDISSPTLQAYRQTHATLNPNHPWSELDNHAFLKEVRAWNYDRETNLEGLTVAGLLMFGKFQSIQDVFPHFALDYQERPDANTEQRWVDRIWLDGSWSGNLYDFYRLVYPKVTAGLKVPFTLKDGLRSEDTPIHEALREALANTLIHADYRHRARVLVVKRPDMYGFQNPGDMRIPLELALRGDEPDSRNKRLAHLFGFVHIGEKAGTGIPKILSGWKSQHWRQPSLTEEHQPSPRTILRLQMLDLFPPGVLDILKLQYKQRFDDLPQAHRLALAITFSERRLTHARLSELTELHPSDVTKTLRELINQQFLVSEGSGRGTIYRFKGSQKVTSDDVFSESSSPDLDTSSPDLNASSPDLDTSSPDLSRSKDGLLISKYHGLNFVDDLDQLSHDKRLELEHLAQLPNAKAKIPRSQMVEVILNLCSGHFITLKALSKLVNRNPNGLRDSYITNLRKDRQLKLAFPDKPNDERQAYTKS